MKSNCWYSRTNVLFWSRLGPHAMFQIFLQALKMSHRHDCRTLSIGLALEKVATSLRRPRAKLWIFWASNEKTYRMLRMLYITDSRIWWGNLNPPFPSKGPYSRWIVGGKLQFMCSKLCSALKLKTRLKAASAPMCVHNIDMFKTGLPQYTYTRYFQWKTPNVCKTSKYSMTKCIFFTWIKHGKSCNQITDLLHALAAGLCIFKVHKGVAHVVGGGWVNRKVKEVKWPERWEHD